jgi:hypothetical protein
MLKPILIGALLFVCAGKSFANGVAIVNGETKQVLN